MYPLNQAYAKHRADRDEFAWMMQQLRIPLFAQQLKTTVIVSVKRLEKMLVGK